MKVIINADDFGFSEVVNESVAQLMEAGRITSATIMANGESFCGAVKLAKQFSKCSFGVHLVLSELAPIEPLKTFREAGMLDEQGRFIDDFRKVKPNWRLQEAVFTEWSRQVQRVLDHGVAVSHFDSHKHVHTIPWLFSPLKRLQRAFGITRIRSSMNWYWRGEAIPSRLLLFKKLFWNKAIRYWPATKTPDHFTTFEWFLKNMNDGETRSSGVAELMVHPGQSYSVEETKLLWSNWQANMPKPVQLINYRDLV